MFLGVYVQRYENKPKPVAATPLDFRGERPFLYGEGAAIEGHGVGMTLAQKIVRLHGESIAVRSEQGKGTLFVVELPHV